MTPPQDMSTSAGSPDFHFSGKWYDCDPSQPALSDAQQLTAICTQALTDAGLAVVDSTDRQFFPSGASAAVHLAGSRLEIRTWPEQRFLALEMWVAPGMRDHVTKAWTVLRTLTTAFRPREAVDTNLRRVPA